MRVQKKTWATDKGPKRWPELITAGDGGHGAARAKIFCPHEGLTRGLPKQPLSVGLGLAASLV